MYGIYCAFRSHRWRSFTCFNLKDCSYFFQIDFNVSKSINSSKIKSLKYFQIVIYIKLHIIKKHSYKNHTADEYIM
jgi:hypothetical protein